MSPLKLANVGGIFIVTVVGCIVAIFVSCFELLISAKEISDETKVKHQASDLLAKDYRRKSNNLHSFF